MSPPVRKAIRPSTSSPSRNERRKPRKKARAAGLFLWGLQKRGRVGVACRERPFLDRTGALLYPFGSMDKRKAWREQDQQPVERGKAAASRFRDAQAALSTPSSEHCDPAQHDEQVLK